MFVCLMCLLLSEQEKKAKGSGCIHTKSGAAQGGAALMDFHSMVRVCNVLGTPTATLLYHQHAGPTNDPNDPTFTWAKKLSQCLYFDQSLFLH